MKLLIALGVVFAVFRCSLCGIADDYYYRPGSVSSSSLSPHSSYSLQNAIEKYIEAYETQQLVDAIQNVCPSYMRYRIRNAVLELKNNSLKMEDNTRTLCGIFRTDFISISQPLIDILEECAPEQSKEIPKFIFDSTLRGIEYICEINGERIFELRNSCIMEMSSKTERCVKDVLSTFKEYRSKKPSKDDLCSLVPSMKTCFYSHVKSACKHPITQNAYIGVFNAVTSECEAVGETNDLVERF